MPPSKRQEEGQASTEMEAGTTVSPELDPIQVPSQRVENGISGRLVSLMAVAVGAMAANNYYNQPLLGDMARTLGVSVGAVGLVPAATQVGYTLGLLFLAPLGDRFNRKRLILLNFGGLVLALIAAALSPTLLFLVGASLGIGLMATITHQIIPFAAQLASPASRGRVVGALMTGLTIGILLSRTVSGTIGEYLGWQAVFWVAFGLAIATAALLVWCLPSSQPTTNLSYAGILSSMRTLVWSEPELREAAIVGALWFASFNVFWTTLAVHIEGPPFHYGTQIAGLFGLVGVVGATASRVSGQLTDRFGSRSVITVSLSAILIAFVLMAVKGETLWGLIASIVLLDLGVFAGQVANQTRIFALQPEARSRINSVYMVCYYTGGALGSATGTWCWATFGWQGVCLLGFSFCCLGYGIHFWRGHQERTVGKIHPPSQR